MGKREGGGGGEIYTSMHQARSDDVFVPRYNYSIIINKNTYLTVGRRKKRNKLVFSVLFY